MRLADRSTSLKTRQVRGPCRAKVKLPAEPVVIIFLDGRHPPAGGQGTVVWRSAACGGADVLRLAGGATPLRGDCLRMRCNSCSFALVLTCN